MSRYNNTPSKTSLQGPLDRTITFTRFPDQYAYQKKELRMSMREFAKHVEKIQKRGKGKLPFYKAASFGPIKSEKNSYRHDGNVREVTGLEVDMDRTSLSFEEAREKLSKAKLAAFIHTTPSHTPESPRWRVWCPFSAALSPEDRYRHMARLNGVLGGGVDPVSFTVSQSFYAGSVAGELRVRTALVDGRYLDKADDLDSVAIGRPNGSPRKHQDAEPAVDQSDNADAVSYARHMLEGAVDKVLAARDGERTHTLYRTAFHLGGFVACGTLDHEECIGALLEAADAIGYASTYGEGAAERHILNGLDGGSDAPNIWRCPREEAEGDFDGLWADMNARPEVLLSLNEEAAIAALVGTPGGAVNPITEAEEPTALTFLTPTDCATLPTRPYVIKGLFGAGDIAAIVGAPGAGKSLLAPYLGYAVAQGHEVFGKRVKQGGVLYVAAEDSHGMRARLSALRGDLGDTQALHLVEGVSDLLSKKGELKALQKAAKERRPRLIVIDTLAVAFPGLEENSAEGMGLVVKAARSLAQWGATVVLVHHDTKAGDGLPRGHSLLNGALDVSLYLKKQGKVVTGQLTKNRNGSTDEKLAFTIETRVTGEDEDGDPTKTAICEEGDASAVVSQGATLTASASAALSVLRELGHGTEWVSEEVWRKVCVEGRTVSPSEKPDSRRAAFRRAVGELVRCKKVTFSHGRFIEGDLSEQGFTDDYDDI